MTEGIALETRSESLRDYLRAIDYGRKDANQWVEPDNNQLLQFGDLFDYFIAGNFDAASDSAQALGATVMQFGADADAESSRYLVLAEVASPGSSDFVGMGTYVVNPAGVGVVIAAPHPKSDLYTGTQAIDLFLNSNARYLFLPGVRRDNHTHVSECSGNGHRVSDASHYHRQYFYVAHERLNEMDKSTVFIQLHGFGAKSLTKLQAQCAFASELMVIISEGLQTTGSVNDSVMSEYLNHTINAGRRIQSCMYGRDTQLLGATHTTIGRMVNGSDDVCQRNASTSSHRFIHIEQSYAVRRHHRDEMSDYINKAIMDLLPAFPMNH